MVFTGYYSGTDKITRQNLLKICEFCSNWDWVDGVAETAVLPHNSPFYTASEWGKAAVFVSKIMGCAKVWKVWAPRKGSA